MAVRSYIMAKEVQLTSNETNPALEMQSCSRPNALRVYPKLGGCCCAEVVRSDRCKFQAVGIQARAMPMADRVLLSAAFQC